jgi:hypothetical protein
MERMMESSHTSIMVRLLMLITALFSAVALLGCNDPIVADMEAEHQRLGSVCQEELRQGISAFPLTSQAEALHPAQ